MADLTKATRQIAIDLINEANGTEYTSQDITLGAPTDNTLVLNGLNTNILLSNTTSASTQEIAVNLQYDRLNFKKLLETPYCQLEDINPSRLVDLLPSLNSKYRINLSSSDIVDGPYRPTDVTASIKSIVLTPQTTNLAYKGSVTIYIGAAAVVADWAENTQYQIAADFVNLSFSGGTHVLSDTNTKVNVKGTVSQGTGLTAAYVSLDGQIKPSSEYLASTRNKLIARFRNGYLSEVLGPLGETSYDATGVILPKVPAIPVKIAEIPEVLGLNASINGSTLTYTTTFNIASKRTSVGQIYYVDGKNGLDTNDGSSDAKAFKTFNRALNVLPLARIIRVKGYTDYYYDSVSGWVSTIRDRTLDVVGYGDAAPIFTSTKAVAPTDWVLQSGNCYYTTATNVGSVVDLTATSTEKGYLRYSAVGSIASCVAASMSYYIDATTNRVYIHTQNNRAPDASILLIAKTQNGAVADKSTVYVEGLRFDLSYTGFIADMTVPKTYGYLYLNSCYFGWTFSNASLSTYGYNVILQGCESKYGFAGGNRYWTDRVLPTFGTKYWVLELGCTITRAGGDGLHTSPASWVATNGTILRLNGVYGYCDGNSVQETGDNTYSLNLGCSSTNIISTVSGVAHYSAGLNSLTEATAQYWSCKFDTTGVSYYPKGVGTTALFDTNIGLKSCTQRGTPYEFLYTA